MKIRLFPIVAIVALSAACGGGDNNTETPPADSLPAAPAAPIDVPVDSAAAMPMDSAAAAMPADSSAVAGDTAAKPPM
jgi:hypothetical protein